MKIAVTAASGALGSAIVEQLKIQQSGAQVIALARTPARAASLGVEVRAGSYDKPEQLLGSLCDIDVLLLVSGNQAPDVRIQQHRNVIEAARRAGVRKIVYTSVQGAEEGNDFSPVIRSNRQTEEDIRQSGLAWSIGRNGIYIEPDIDYIESYKAQACIRNCAGDSACGYTTRKELAYAYTRMLLDDSHNGQTYNLHGEPLTQTQLAEYLNRTFNAQLVYEPVSVDAFRRDRAAELGEFLGGIITGIYQGIRDGHLNNPSHFEQAAGRPHQSWDDFFATLI